MKSFIKSAFFIFLLICGYTNAQTITYVNINATGSNNGTSWLNAYTSLTTAINYTVTNRQIWVAKGTYVGPVTFGFHMKNNLAIYGGFDGTETSLAQRNWTLNVTTLKGNTDTRVICNYSNSLDSTAILDGFTITGGYVNSSDIYHLGGGGILNYSSSPTMQNLIVRNNSVDVSVNYNGGGIYNYNSKVHVKNVHVVNNFASKGGGIYNEGVFLNIPTSTFEFPKIAWVTIDSNNASYGGGIYNNGCPPYIDNSAIINNNAYIDGGGIYTDNSASSTFSLNIVNTLIAGNAGEVGSGIYNSQTKANLLNVTITGNHASVGGAAGIYNKISDINIANSIVYSNIKAFTPFPQDPNLINDSYSHSYIKYSIISGIQDTSTHCFDLNPQFIDSANGNYRLKSTSPAINFGSNNSYTSSSTVDLDSNLRSYGIIDMGAYEFQGSVAGIKKQKNDSFTLSIYPNPVTSTLTIRFNKPVTDAELLLTDINGKEIIKQQKINSEKEIINVSQLQEGVYFLKTTIANETQINKIVIIK